MLLKQTLRYLPAQLVGPLFLFIATVAWTHWLMPEHLGTMTLILITHELMHVVLVSWFSHYVVRYHSRAASGDERRRLLESEATILALACAASVSVSVLILTRVENGLSSPGLLLASIAFMATRSISLHLADRARAEDEVMSYSVIQIATSALGLVLGILAAHYVAATPTVAIAGLALAQLIAIVACLRALTPLWRPGRPDRDVLRAALAYGLPFIASGPLIWAAVNGLRYIVEFALGSAALGLVTVGWALGQRGASVAALVTTAAAFPLAVRRTREQGLEKGAEQLASNAVLLLILLAPAMGGLWVLGPQLTNAVVAEAYREATIAVIPLAALAGLVRNMRMHFTNQIFLLHERTDVALRIDVLDAVASLGLAFIGLALWGVYGAVAGATAGAIVTLVIGSAVGMRWYGLVIPFSELIRILLATAVMVAALWHAPDRVGLLGLAIEVAAGAAIYAVALVAVMPRVLTRALDVLRPRSGSAS